MKPRRSRGDYCSEISSQGQLIQKPEFRDLGELDFELKAIPPTYAPPRPPPGGKPLTNRQKVALAAAILVTILIVVLLGLFLQHRV